MAERLMRRLASGGRTGVFLGTLVVVLAVLALPGWPGALLLIVMGAIMAMISRWTWPVQAPKTRAMRVAILALLLLLAYLKVR